MEEVQPLIERIVEVIRTCYDPEIPVNIYDLGLVYRIDLKPADTQAQYDLTIDMTLTAPGCPMADVILDMTKECVSDLRELKTVYVNLVWDPPWDKSKMSEEALLQLDMF